MLNSKNKNLINFIAHLSNLKNHENKLYDQYFSNNFTLTSNNEEINKNESILFFLNKINNKITKYEINKIKSISENNYILYLKYTSLKTTKGQEKNWNGMITIIINISNENFIINDVLDYYENKYQNSIYDILVEYS
jgi:hypothetical protein